MDDTTVKKIREKLKMTQSDFAKRCGVTIRTVQNWESGGEIPESRMKFLEGLVREILHSEPSVARMLSDKRPHLPASAEAGAEGGFSFAVEAGDCEQRPRIPNFPDYDMTISVQGDSMEPEFMAGDVVALRRVSEFVEWGRPHVVDTHDGAKLKKVYAASDGGIRCVSINPSYPEYTIPAGMIHGLYRVVGLLRNF